GQRRATPQAAVPMTQGQLNGGPSFTGRVHDRTGIGSRPFPFATAVGGGPSPGLLVRQTRQALEGSMPLPPIDKWTTRSWPKPVSRKVPSLPVVTEVGTSSADAARPIIVTPLT